MTQKSHNLNLVATYSRLVNKSPFFTNWLGFNQQIIQGTCVRTSNRLLKDYHLKGIDNKLNVVALKQLITYENFETTYKILQEGLQVVYQSYSLKVWVKKSCLYVQVDNLKTSFTQTLKISKTNLNKLSRVIDNQDAVDTLQSVYNRIERDLGV
jgi:hypothetical protein